MIAKRRRTPVPNRPARMATDHQEQQRARRRGGFTSYYRGNFLLSEEFSAVFGPLERRVSDLPLPVSCRSSVLELVDAAHECTATIAGWAAEIDARAKTEHLAGQPGTRRRAVQLLVDTAPRPAAPSITDGDIIAGQWVTAVVAMATEVDNRLAKMLDAAWPPEHPALRGRPSRSAQLNALLRETVDRAALALERRATRAASWHPAPVQSDPADELRALGVATA